MSQCRFTIAVPVFNSEKYLQQCIESVLQQDFDDFELLLIDDCSTDNSNEIIRSYENKDNRIKVVFNSKNVGISQTRNKGIKLASGTYLLFLDSDDFLSPESLKKISEHLQVDTDLILFDHYEIRLGDNRKKIKNIEDKMLKNQKVQFFKKNDILDLAYESYKKHLNNRLFGSCWGRVYRTSLIKKHGITFDKDLPMIEDVVFNYNFLRICNNLIYFNEYLYNYRIHDFFVSASSQLPKNFLVILDKIQTSIIQYYSEVSQLDIKTINRIASQKCMHYFMVYLVRICGGIYTKNLRGTYHLINEFVNSSTVKKHIKNYSPRKGHSKILPFLIRAKLVILIILFGNKRYNKRYVDNGSGNK